MRGHDLVSLSERELLQQPRHRQSLRQLYAGTIARPTATFFVPDASTLVCTVSNALSSRRAVHAQSEEPSHIHIHERYLSQVQDKVWSLFLKLLFQFPNVP